MWRHGLPERGDEVLFTTRNRTTPRPSGLRRQHDRADQLSARRRSERTTPPGSPRQHPKSPAYRAMAGGTLELQTGSCNYRIDSVTDSQGITTEWLKDATENHAQYGATDVKITAPISAPVCRHNELAEPQ